MSEIRTISKATVLDRIRSLTTNKSSKEDLEKGEDSYEKSKIIDDVTYKKPKMIDSSGVKNLADASLLKEEIRKTLLKKTRDLLAGVFEENPEMLEEVENGKVPDYFNEENTAKRILKIYFDYFLEDEDRDKFVERASSLIKKAYSDVIQINNEQLPELVNDTRYLIFDKLEEFKNGQSIEDIYASLGNFKETKEVEKK
jgi:hypothetical protein